MSIDLIANLQRQLQALDERSLTRRLRVVDTPCLPNLTVDGRALLAFCSNDYLGLAAHPRMIDALREGAARYGVGSGGSALIGGHSRAHALLEERLAEFLSPHIESARALYLCSGYMANMAVLTALGADADSEIFSETLNHASLIDGARLARASVKVYPHADLVTLSAQLAASNARTKLVVTDSVFSMDGNLAPLPALLALCEQHGAWLVVDDAHGFGTLGAHGRGALEHFGLHSPNLVYVGTLSKAAGVGGAFVAAHASVIEMLVQRARPFIYTTAPAPALAHALLTSVELISGAEGAERRAQLASLIVQLGAELRLERWQLLPSFTGIQPILIGANDETLRVSAGLLEQRLWVPAIRPPTVPLGTARLRLTLSAAHTSAEVAQLCSALNTLERN